MHVHEHVITPLCKSLGDHCADPARSAHAMVTGRGGGDGRWQPKHWQDGICEKGYSHHGNERLFQGLFQGPFQGFCCTYTHDRYNYNTTHEHPLVYTHTHIHKRNAKDALSLLASPFIPHMRTLAVLGMPVPTPAPSFFGKTRPPRVTRTKAPADASKPRVNRSKMECRNLVPATTCTNKHAHGAFCREGQE
jgi:hypothetical protein